MDFKTLLEKSIEDYPDLSPTDQILLKDEIQRRLKILTNPFNRRDFTRTSLN
jgi:hypothetical protein